MMNLPSDEDRREDVKYICDKLRPLVADLDMGHDGVHNFAADVDDWVSQMLGKFLTLHASNPAIGNPLHLTAIFLGMAAACLVGGRIGCHADGELFAESPDNVLVEKRRFMQSYVMDVAEQMILVWHERQGKIVMQERFTDPWEGRDYQPPMKN